MEKYNFKNDFKVFGFQVKTFPDGIGKAFDDLVKMVPGGFSRSFYGICKLGKSGNMEYYATAEEISPGEAEKYKLDRYTIEKGEYLTETIRDWRKKTDSINKVFHKMMEDKRVDRTKPLVEWYKNEEEMLCMVKASVMIEA